MGLAGITQILSSKLGDLTFKDTRIPFACTAVDIRSSQEIVLNDGKLIDAVLATVAVPGVFPPRECGNYLFVDGAILDPVPVAVARWLAPDLPVAASVLTPPPENWAGLPPFQLPVTSPLQERVLEQIYRLRFGQALNIFIQSMDITSRMLTELRLQVDQPEVIIRPNVDHISMLQDVDPQELIRIGTRATAAVLPELRSSFRWQGKLARRLRRVTPPGRLINESH
jgi:NTE family protein